MKNVLGGAVVELGGYLATLPACCKEASRGNVDYR